MSWAFFSWKATACGEWLKCHVNRLGGFFLSNSLGKYSKTHFHFSFFHIKLSLCLLVKNTLNVLSVLYLFNVARPLVICLLDTNVWPLIATLQYLQVCGKWIGTFIALFYSEQKSTMKSLIPFTCTFIQHLFDTHSLRCIRTNLGLSTYFDTQTVVARDLAWKTATGFSGIVWKGLTVKIKVFIVRPIRLWNLPNYPYFSIHKYNSDGN